MSVKKTAPKKPGKALIPWEEELAQAAQKQSKAPKTGGGERTFISLKGGMISIGDKVVKERKLDVIVLDFAYVNAYYDKPYNPKQPTSPACYAISREQEALAPHKDAPEHQNDTCYGCPMNEFGSRGDGGNGKACKNSIRLTVMVAGGLDGDIGAAAIAYLMVPPTSLKSFAGLYKEECCDEEGLAVKPTYAFVTTIEVEPDTNTQFRVHFNRAPGNPIGREQFYALRSKVEALGDDVMFTFPKLEDMQKRGNGSRAPAKKAKY